MINQTIQYDNIMISHYFTILHTGENYRSKYHTQLQNKCISYLVILAGNPMWLIVINFPFLYEFNNIILLKLYSEIV